MTERQPVPGVYGPGQHRDSPAPLGLLGALFLALLFAWFWIRQGVDA